MAGVEYTYSVRAYHDPDDPDIAGCGWGPKAADVGWAGHTVAAPTNLTATDDRYAYVHLDWDQSEHVTENSVWRDGVLISQEWEGIPYSAYMDRTMTPGQVHSYEVKAAHHLHDSERRVH